MSQFTSAGQSKYIISARDSLGRWEDEGETSSDSPAGGDEGQKRGSDQFLILGGPLWRAVHKV